MILLIKVEPLGGRGFICTTNTTTTKLVNYLPVLTTFELSCLSLQTIHPNCSGPMSVDAQLVFDPLQIKKDVPTTGHSFGQQYSIHFPVPPFPWLIPKTHIKIT